MFIEIVVVVDRFYKMGIKVIFIGIGKGVNQVELEVIFIDFQYVYCVDDYDVLYFLMMNIEIIICGYNGKEK